MSVRYPLKGTPDGPQVSVIHFKFGKLKDGRDDFEGIMNGPQFMAFRTTREHPVVKGALLPPPEYLLFLRKRPDGRYEPVSGQIAPYMSVRALSFPDEPPMPGEEEADRRKARSCRDRTRESRSSGNDGRGQPVPPPSAAGRAFTTP